MLGCYVNGCTITVNTFWHMVHNSVTCIVYAYIILSKTVLQSVLGIKHLFHSSLNFSTIHFLFNKYSVSYVSYELEGTQNCKPSCKVFTIVCYFDHKQNMSINFSFIPSIKFHENPISRSKVVSCIQKMDSTILKGATV